MESVHMTKDDFTKAIKSTREGKMTLDTLKEFLQCAKEKYNLQGHDTEMTDIHVVAADLIECALRCNIIDTGMRTKMIDEDSSAYEFACMEVSDLWQAQQHIKECREKVTHGEITYHLLQCYVRHAQAIYEQLDPNKELTQLFTEVNELIEFACSCKVIIPEVRNSILTMNESFYQLYKEKYTAYVSGREAIWKFVREIAVPGVTVPNYFCREYIYVVVPAVKSVNNYISSAVRNIGRQTVVAEFVQFYKQQIAATPGETMELLVTIVYMLYALELISGKSQQELVGRLSSNPEGGHQEIIQAMMQGELTNAYASAKTHSF